MLAVCADPQNLPYSDERGRGFENRIAELVADELRATVHYTWGLQRRSFLRKTLNTGSCDVVVGAPQGLAGLLQTRPYYESTYVFVTRRGLELQGLDDPQLRKLRIGVPALGLEGTNTPPVMALARRGIVEHVTGYSVWDTSTSEAPQARIVDAVARGEIDVAVLWGPTAGYFAQRHGRSLALTPIEGDPKQPELAFRYAISLGVRRGSEPLRDELQQVLERRRDDIDAILREYGVPIVAPTPARAQAAALREASNP